MATDAMPGVPGPPTVSIGSSSVRLRWQDRRRDEFEAVGLVLAMFGVLLLVVLTLGSAVPFGP